MAEDRRTALKVLTGVLGGGAAALVAGPAVRAIIAPITLDPIQGIGNFVRVAKLSDVPDDGAPVNVPVVIQAPRDAWNKLPPTTVGAVFLVRRDTGVVAFSTICPHLGCGIDYQAEKKSYACPCHESSFGPEGDVSGGPSPRGMDVLETRVVGEDVEVKFVKFVIGKAEKVQA